MKSTKNKLLSSIATLCVCFAMLIGSTYAWFTDSASTGVNKIQAGNLDVQLLMYDEEADDYIDISDATKPIFGYGSSLVAQNNNADTLWEPGKTQVAYLAIKNNGTLDLKYKVDLKVTNPEDGKNLYEVMRYSITPGAENGGVTSWDPVEGKQVTVGNQMVSDADVSLKKGETHYFALSVHMEESAGNPYKDGKVDFDLTVYAAQLSSEEDSFDNTYDMWAEYDSTSTTAPPTINVGGAAQLKEALQGLSTTGTINLTQDIDLAGVDWESPTMSYTPNTETIVINGNGHTISNLTSSNNQYGGLIGKLSTNGNVVIKNINFVNVNLTGTNNDGECAGGALIGWMDCHDGTVTVQDVTVNGINIDGFKNTGGLIGYKNTNTELNISNCSVTGTDENKTIKSSYNENNGEGYKGHIGGLVGYYGKGTILNCSMTNIDIARSGETQKDRAGVLVGTLASGASITSATVSNVTLLGTPVTSGSNMVGPDASDRNATVHVTVAQ